MAEYIEMDKDSVRTWYQNLMNPNEYAQYLNSIVNSNADSMVKSINVKLNKNFFEKLVLEEPNEAKESRQP